MKCNQFEKTKSRHHNHMNNLDQALHDLGMLSAITEARREFLCESKSNFAVTRIPSASKLYWMKRTTKNRLCPYVLPDRHRTKSENSDVVANDTTEGCECKNPMFEPSTSSFNRDVVDIKSPAKRCQSLENLTLAVDPPPGPEISPDMDCVSTRIQKLQVDE